ncbi:uncharacterized protein LOC141696728 [Apium graveolens]|uniref:uncharacterized protein LOC141696728 n=1 Tax=Apium graveolens TaxID=4045 RepID=UPI003D797782
MASVLIPIPFTMWAINIIGVLPTTTRHEKYCIIAIDYMTKWVEAKPLSIITEEAAKKFFLEQIILSFGTLRVYFSNTGMPFVRKKFRRFLHHFGVQQRFISVAHSQNNGAVEAANKVIFQGIKKHWAKPREDGRKSFHGSYELTK